MNTVENQILVSVEGRCFTGNPFILVALLFLKKKNHMTKYFKSISVSKYGRNRQQTSERSFLIFYRLFCCFQICHPDIRKSMHSTGGCGKPQKKRGGCTGCLSWRFNKGNQCESESVGRGGWGGSLPFKVHNFTFSVGFALKSSWSNPDGGGGLIGTLFIRVAFSCHYSFDHHLIYIFFFSFFKLK